MKKSLKGIVLASLISTQVLTAPISAFAVTAETTESSEQVGPQITDELVEEVVVPDAAEESQKDTAVAETPTQEAPVDTPVQEEAEVPVPVVPVAPEAPEAPIAPLEDMPAATASEAKKQELRTAIANAQTLLNEGTYTAETVIPLQEAMSAATLLLSQTDVTDEQLEVAIINVNGKAAGLVKAELELSFLGNLITAIDEATQIINNTDEFKDIYTPASVATKKAGIQTAADAGKVVLASVIGADGKISAELAIDHREEIEAAAAAITAAIHGGAGLVRRDSLAEILLEASQLEGAKVATDADKADFEAALKQAVNAFDNALTDGEADAAVSALRNAMDNLRLLVVVSAVDEKGNLLMNQKDTTLNGLYKTAWTVKAPVIEGYEYVSTNNQPVTFTRAADQAVSGTFGDGVNDVTFTYKKVVTYAKPPYVPAPETPVADTPQPDIINVVNNTVNKTTDKTYVSKKKLPQTGEQTSAMTSFGLLAVAAGAVAFFKKRKIKE